MDTEQESSSSSVQCPHCPDVHPTSFSHCPNTGRALSAGRALVGRTIAERYRVLALIGEGGMGAVYVAEHLMIGRKVALKRLHPELASDEQAVRRFQREARAAASTGHENVVDVLDLGFSEDGAPFLVMEYLRGRSLAQVLRVEKMLSAQRACRILGQVLAALSAVHARGIVHRDLKPDNVILTPRAGDPEFVKVVDFGVSKMRGEDDGGLALTRTGVTLGTPYYMSPEQARGVRDLDHRADLYAAGVMLYECLAGRLPYEGSNYHQLLQAILSGERPELRSLRPDLPPRLGEVVDRAIAADPEARFATAREMLLALVPFGANDPGELPEPAIGTAPDPDAKTTPRWLRASRDEAPRPTMAGRPRLSAISGGEGERPRPSLVGASERARPYLTGAVTIASTPVAKRRARRGLAPEPRSLQGSPRRFVAQSADWDERAVGTASLLDEAKARDPFPREEATGRRARLPAGMRGRLVDRGEDDPRPRVLDPGNESSPPKATSVDAPARPTRVKGSMVSVALEMVTAQLGGRERVFERLDKTVAASLQRVILPMSWLPLRAYVELLRVAEREHSAAEGVVAARIGRETAERELTTTHRFFVQGATLSTVVERIPQVFRAYHTSGNVLVDTDAPGVCTVRTQDVSPDTLVHAHAMSGYYQRLLELAGALDVRATVAACRERGDDATITILRWR